MKVRTGYKQSGVGEIPNDWEEKRLGDGVDLISGHHVLAHYCNTDGRGTPYLTGPADFPEGAIRITKFTVRPATLCRPGDILVTVKGSGAGSTVLADGEYCISRQLMAIRSAAWDVNFLHETICRNAAKLSAAATGLIPGLSREDLLGAQLAIPPLEEQRAISAALGDVDALLAGLEGLVAKKRDLKQAAMDQLLTGQTRLPGFQGEWVVKSLGELCSLKSGQAITSENIDDHSPYRCFGGNGLRGRTRSYTHEGAFALIGRQGALCGNVVGVEGKFFASEHALVVTARPAVSIAWLTFVLGRMNLNQYSESSAQPGLSAAKLLLLDVRTPPSAAEQAAIAAVLTDMDAELTTLKARRDKTRALKQGMMQELLTGRTLLV